MYNRHLARSGVALLLFLLLLSSISTAPEAAPPDSNMARLSGVIGEILSTQSSPLPEITAALGRQPVDVLRAFYARRDDAPLWVSPTIPTAEAEWALDLTPQALPEEVRPLMTAAQSARGSTDPAVLAKLELLLSAIYAVSSVDPRDPLTRQDGQRSLSLLSVADDRFKLVRDTLPVDPGFWRLRQAIISYRRLDAMGGWPEVPAGRKLELGDGDPRVELLRRRLIVTDDLAAGSDGETFDGEVKEAVEHFQARHGLQADGVVATKTLAALNVPLKQRLATMLINLGRLQHQHRDWGQRYVAVNVAAASYQLVLDGHMVFERPAVVGKPGWPTPTLDSVIDRVEFHPYWRIPMNIAEQEVWPKQDADPHYFAEQGIHISGQWLVQDPGPRNPLGDVKFVFDNPYSVYLHDTSAPELFARAYRFASHGCIRIADAGDLARRLLASDPTWPAAKVDGALQADISQGVSLTAPIPVHIVYGTAWVDEDGTVEFREDVYHRDLSAHMPASVRPAMASKAQAEDCAG
jgi:murein L,D-transpeptidase YcbB/YkuD